MIRKIRDDEVEAIMKIWINVSIKAHDFIPAEHWKNNYCIVKDEYVPKSETYVYIEDDHIVGFISIHDKHYIGAVFVDDKYQGKGIGTKLTNYAKVLYNNLDLICYKKNEKSVNFYKNAGFQIKKMQVDKHTSEEEYVMEWCKKTSK